MTAPSKPTICIAPATEDDYDRLIEWKHTLLEGNDPVLDRVFAYPERATEDISRTREMIADPSNNMFKAILVRGEDEGDPMVGYVTIKMQGENWIEKDSVEEAKKGAQPLPNRVDPEVLDQLLRNVKQTRRRLMGGKPHLIVQLLCVDPVHQRVGAGSALMKYVMQLALDANVSIYVEATRKGGFLYDRLGFEVERLHLNLPGGGTVSFPVIMKSV